MSRIESQVAPRSAAFQENARAFDAGAAAVREAAAWALEGGGAAARARHEGRGKLAPRVRVERLLDPGSPFLEVGLFAAHGMYDGDAPAA
ncbi:MAG: methylcrotonoyl-CoA carboxylase, partial [Pseudomonadota bacterium]